MVAVCGLGIGAVALSRGTGDAAVRNHHLRAAAALLRVGLIALYVAVSLLGLTALGLFISTLTDVPVGAMAAIAVLAVTAQILGQLPQLDWLHPWLFTHHWLGFADLLRDPIRWTEFGQNALLQGGYLLVFGALAYGRFASKDVLS